MKNETMNEIPPNFKTVSTVTSVKSQDNRHVNLIIPELSSLDYSLQCVLYVYSNENRL